MQDTGSSQLLLVGTSHSNAPVEIRERLWCQETSLPERLKSVVDGSRGVKEAVILSTCNRTEVYTISARNSDVGSYIAQLMSRWGGFDGVVPQHHLYFLSDQDAASHLFAVASGLDSLVMGEKQIQDQVKEAFRLATQEGTTGQFLTDLFQRANRVAKKVRKVLQLGEASVSTTVVSLLGHLSHEHHISSLLLVGAGKMITLALQQLIKNMRLEVMIANRTIERARELAEKMGGKPLSLDEIPSRLQTVDAVLCCTSSPSYVLLSGDLEEAMSKRKFKPLILIDIAVPRNIDPSVANTPGVHLYNIDDLQPHLGKTLESRKSQIAEAEQYIRREAEKLFGRTNSHDVTLTIRALRLLAEGIRREELARALRKLQGLSNGDRRIVDLLSKSIVNKLLHEPTVRLRALEKEGEAGTYNRAMRELFRVDD